MAENRLNIIKSKNKEKLFWNGNLFLKIIDTIVPAILLLSFPLMFGAIFIQEAISDGYWDFYLGIFLSTSILSFLFILSATKINNLKLIKGQGLEINRKAVISIVENLNYHFERNTKQYAIINLPWSLSSSNWGRQLIIIYKNDDILINCTTFGLHDLKSPFHYFGNKDIVSNFEEKFIEYIETTKR